MRKSGWNPENGLLYETVDDQTKLKHTVDAFCRPKKCFHMHSTFEICVVASGHVTVECSTRCAEMHAPYVVVYRPNLPHRVHVSYDEGAYDRYVFTCNDALLQNMIRWVPAVQTLFSHAFFAFMLTPAQFAQTRQLLERAESLFLQNRREASYLLISAALEELTTVLPEADVRAAYGSGELDETVRYLLAHISEKLEIADVAAHFYISESKLVKDFRAAYGLPFHQFVMQLRVKRAREMLAQGASGVTVWRACGFASHSHFINVFRQYVGQSPGQYNGSE